MDSNKLTGYLLFDSAPIELLVSNYYNYNLQNILSIGSGNGYVESVLEKVYGINVICVEPNINRYSTIYMHPKFNTIDDMVFCNTDNTYMFINYPDPHQLVQYDYSAIENISPDMFMVTYSPSGGSGSDKLINEFGDYNNPPRRKLIGYTYYNLSYCCNTTVKFNDSMTKLYRVINYAKDNTWDGECNIEHKEIVWTD